MATALTIQEAESAFRAYSILGLVWVAEHGEPIDGERDAVLHGPFTDFTDAFDQCGRPSSWRVA